MSERPRFTESIALRAIPVLFAVTLAYSGLIEEWDYVLYDFTQRTTIREPSDSIVIVAIDQESIDEIGRWPWPRSVHAELVDLLSEGGVTAIGLDIIFAEPSVPENDAALVAAIKASQRVVLPVVKEQQRLGGQLREVLPINAMTEGAVALGHIDRPLDFDSINRAVYLKAGLGDPHWPSFGLAMLGVSDPEVLKDLPGARSSPDSGGSPLLWNQDHHLLVSFAGPPGHFPRVSYIDLLSGVFPAARLRDKLVLVGGTATGLGDHLATPVSSESMPMPGVEIIANEMDTILKGLGITIMPLALVLLSTAVLVATPMQLLPALSPRWAILAIIGAVASGLLFSAFCLLFLHVWFSPLAAILGTVVGYIAWSWRRLVAVSKYLNRSLSALESNPIMISSNDTGDFKTSLDFVADILPVRGAKIVDGTGAVVEDWTHPETATGQAELVDYIWRDIDSNGSRLGLLWADDRTPDSAESRVMEELAMYFSKGAKVESSSPIERMERSINQVQSATRRMEAMRIFITQTLEQMADGVIVANNFGRVLLVNKSVLAMMGEPENNSAEDYSLSELWNKVQFKNAKASRKILRKALVDREPSVAEGRGPGGKDLLVQVVPFQNDPMEDGIIVDIVDISVFREAERTRKEMLSFLSHDLRSPLASILAITEILRLEQDLIQDEQYMKRIDANARRALNMADDFLQVLNAERIEPDTFQPVNLVEAMSDAISSMEDLANKKNTKLVSDLNGAILVQGHAKLLERAFSNLISNAIKYSPANSTVAIGAEVNGGNANCWIRDEGYGIESKYVDDLFERFKRIHRKEHETEEGTGLGLVFVKTVVENHKGAIQVESELNKGSTFKVVLPVAGEEQGAGGLSA